MTNDNDGLSSTERLVRDKLRNAGILGPNSETTKTTVKRASTINNNINDSNTDSTKSINPDETEEKTPEELAAIFDNEKNKGIANAILATKPILNGKKEKEIDDRFLSLEDLPSNFYPYPDRDKILARPFAITELKLIARAIETGDSDFITQALDNCIDFPVTELTIVDYFYLYYWMRIQSYPNTPHYMEWKCDEMLADADEPDNKSSCDYENTTPLTQKELKVIYLDDLSFDYDQLDPRLDFPRVSLLQDLTLAQESKTAIQAGKNADAKFSLDDLVLVNAAKWIKAGTTLREKIEILEREPDLELYEIASKTNKAFEYGVYEYAMVKCGRCGAKRRYRVLLDAPRFFPFAD